VRRDLWTVGRNLEDETEEGNDATVIEAHQRVDLALERVFFRGRKLRKTFHRELSAGCVIQENVDWNTRAFVSNFHRFKP
jgi:hypothetical protein